jgi:hypothetical protein
MLANNIVVDVDRPTAISNLDQQPVPVVVVAVVFLTCLLKLTVAVGGRSCCLFFTLD